MTNLTLDEKKALIRMALEAREQAYVPYSDFMVGAALRVKMAASSPAAMWKTLPLPPPAVPSARPYSRR